MLDAVIENYKKKLEGAMNLEKKKQELEKQMQDLNQKNIEIESQIKSNDELFMELNKKSKIVKRFSRGYKQKTKKIRDDNNSLNAAEVQNSETIIQLQQELNEIAKKQNGINFEEEMERINVDKQYAIQRIISENPNLCENEIFMMDIIEVNPSNIIYDKTNSDRLFKKFFAKVGDIIQLDAKIQELKEQMDSYPKDDLALIESTRLRISELVSLRDIYFNISEELTSPKTVLDGRYKVPHKYLFEAIKKRIIMFHKEDSAPLANTIEEEILRCAKTYFEYDGKMTKELGAEIQKMYDDPNSDLYFHCIWAKDEKKSDILNQIFSDGLQLRTDYEKQASRTTVSQRQLQSNFFQFLDGDYKVILSMPNTPLLGIEEGQHYHFLPEYVVGCMVNTENGCEFIKDPIPFDQRKKYDDITEACTENFDFESIYNQGGKSF